MTRATSETRHVTFKSRQNPRVQQSCFYYNGTIDPIANEPAGWEKLLSEVIVCKESQYDCI